MTDANDVERGFLLLGHNRDSPPLHAGYEVRNTSLSHATVSEAITAGLGWGWSHCRLYRVQRTRQPDRWEEVAGPPDISDVYVLPTGQHRTVRRRERLVPGEWGPWTVVDEVVA